MVLLKNVRWLFVMFFLFVACEEKWNTNDVDCDECFYEKPVYGDLEVSFTTEGIENDTIMLIFYEQSFDPHNIIDTFYAVSSPFYIIGEPLGHDFAVAAHYQKNGNTYIAVDGTKMIAKRVSSACEQTCWVVTKSFIDVRLKY